MRVASFRRTATRRRRMEKNAMGAAAIVLLVCIVCLILDQLINEQEE